MRGLPGDTRFLDACTYVISQLLPVQVSMFIVVFEIVIPPFMGYLLL